MRLGRGLVRVPLLVSMKVRNTDHIVSFHWAEVDIIGCLSGRFLQNELVQIVICPVAELR